MKLHDYTEQLLSLYNFYDGGIMVNKDCVIEYYHNNRPDINTLSESELIGKTIFEIYPSINEKNSTLLRVIHTGMPMHQHYQKLENYKGEQYGAICSTLPIFDEEKIVGAVEIFMYTTNHEKFLNINLQDFGLLDGEPIAQNLDDIISVSEEMQTLKERIAKVARTKSTVMIYGETGTGKELVARAIHNGGSRKNKRYLSQNCAAIPENLLESILFGTTRGSFTGAENRPGLFEIASGGTLFLDEINSMDLAVQAKILKAIEEQKIRRIGGTEDILIDVRIIAATNEDPLLCMQRGSLREDLYYRLKVVQLNIPPLRSRKEDIRPLTEYYINFYNTVMGKSIQNADAQLMRLFYQYSWPGNVRELRNMIEGGFNLCENDVLCVDCLDRYSAKALRSGGRESIPLTDENRTLKESTRLFERSIILKILSETSSMTEAAEKMGITRQTLNNKLKEHQIKSTEISRSKDHE